MRVEDALTHAGGFLDAASLGNDRIVFLCHGHGTGALKQAVRAWLPTVRCVQRWRAADATEGGDGWTVVEMRG
jgi:DNA mismatch repair protein MutS2